MKINIIGNNALAHSLKMAFTVLNYDVEMGSTSGFADVFKTMFGTDKSHIYTIVCEAVIYKKIAVPNAIAIAPFHQIFYKEKAFENSDNTIINCSLENYNLIKEERAEAGIDKIKGMKLFITKEGATQEQIELVKKVFAGTGIEIDFKETIQEVNTIFYKNALPKLLAGGITMQDLKPYLEIDAKSFVNALKI